MTTEEERRRATNWNYWQKPYNSHRSTILLTCLASSSSSLTSQQQQSSYSKMRTKSSNIKHDNSNLKEDLEEEAKEEEEEEEEEKEKEEQEAGHMKEVHKDHANHACCTCPADCRLQQQPPLQTLTKTSKHHRRPQISLNVVRDLLKLFAVNIILSHLNELNYISSRSSTNQDITTKLLEEEEAKFFPRILLATAIECKLDADCANEDKFCNENKCICLREKPIEDLDRCLQLALINEQCSVTEQCLGNSLCVDGICTCGNEGISLYNPSSKIYYCHPKRRLNQQCNYDSQCPENAYCSTDKYGCLCQNGFAPGTIVNGNIETVECLAKFCTKTSTCESEFHQCEDNKCKCLAAHFDPTTAKCYKFGSTGGKPTKDDNDDGGGGLGASNGNVTSIDGNNNFVYTILKDLTENSDRMWLVLIILISLSILLFVLIFMLVRKHYLGYCWTAHKKEYEPNNKTQARNGYFNKDPINNMSFRRKRGEGEVQGDEEDELTGSSSSVDRSTLISSSSSPPKTKDNPYVRVNMTTSDNNNHHHHQQDISDLSFKNANDDDPKGPLRTSTSSQV